MEFARQRTDNIHGTIYLSAFESELVSTPFFYRLHDIYQSSTVYLTFPSNRTKRYEHSLGTMALASKMLFSSLANADAPVHNAFIRQLNAYFVDICQNIFSGHYHHCYLGSGRDILVDLVRKTKFDRLYEGQWNKADDKIDEVIKESYNKGILADDALNRFNLHIYPTVDSHAEKNVRAVRERFIYQCILQAIRIVALFHDVGHPPYSHIIEATLEELYNRYTSDKSIAKVDNDRARRIEKSLGRFFGEDKEIFEFLNINSPAISEHLHEQVGLYMFRMAVETVMATTLKTFRPEHSDNETSSSEKLIQVLYYITCIEFSAAILLEKNPLYRSIHRIIDGVVDADRLDYVVRDSRNSGVDWGSVPYTRLVDSAKMMQITEKGELDKTNKSNLFVIAYPQKVSVDIEDFLLNRYRIFARINYHHRCAKTAAALQSAVKFLSEDYLYGTDYPLPAITDPDLASIDEKLLHQISSLYEGQYDFEKSFSPCINSDINILWTALAATNGDEALKVLQWNDSWMVSVLQSALLRISTEESFTEKSTLSAVRKAWRDIKDTDFWKEMDRKQRSDYLVSIEEKKKNDLVELRKNLEEFLLNKKSYHSLFKRGVDIQHFIQEILKYAELSPRDIEIQLNEEKSKYLDAAKRDPSLPSLWDCLDNTEESTKDDAIGAIRRLSRFLEAIETGDLKSISSIIIPTDQDDTVKIIKSVLDRSKESHEIIDYKIQINGGWEKMGLPDHGNDATTEIYLYNDGSLFKYDDTVSLKPQIRAIKSSMLWLYVYIMVAEDCEDTNQLMISLRTQCAKELGKRIRNRYNELFHGHS